MIPSELKLTVNEVINIDSSINPRFSPTKDYLLLEITDSIQLFKVRKLVEEYQGQVDTPVVIRGVGRGVVPSITLYHLYKREKTAFDICCTGSTFNALVNGKKEDMGIQLVLTKTPPSELDELNISYPNISKGQVISVNLVDYEPGFFPRSDYLLVELFGSARLYSLKREIIDYTRKNKKAPVVFRAVGYKGIPIAVRIAHALKTEKKCPGQLIETFSAVTRIRDNLTAKTIEKKLTGIQIVAFKP